MCTCVVEVVVRVVVRVVVFMVDQVRRPEVEERPPRDLAYSRYGQASSRMGSTRRQTSLGLPLPHYPAGRCSKLPSTPNFLSV